MMVELSPVLDNPLIKSLLTAFDGSLFSMVITDANADENGHKFLYVNAQFLSQTGYSIQELVGKSPRILQGKNTDRDLLNKLKKTIYSGETFVGQTVNYRKNGSEYLVRWSINPIRDEHGQIVAFLSCQMEISEQIKDHQITYFLSEALNQTSDAVLVTDLSGKIVFSNQALSNLTGYTKDELINQQARIFRSGEMPPDFYKSLWTTLLQNKAFDGVFLNKHKNGSLYYEHKTISPVLDDQHKPMYYMAISRDTTEAIETTKQLTQKAFYDALTGLFNRFKFNELLEDYYQAYQQTGRVFSLMIADIDNFKQINDTYGHDAGDLVLNSVAQCIKTSQGELAAARWGGEEFAVLFHANLTEAMKLSQQIVETVEKIDVTKFGLNQVTISAGVAAINENIKLEELFNLTDRALYLAKHEGKNCVRTLQSSSL